MPKTKTTMILVCEACHTKYLVKANSIGSDGRLVKCAKCGNTWIQSPDESDIENTEDGAPIEKAPIPEGSNLPVPQPQEDIIPLWLKVVPVALSLLLFLVSTIMYSDSIIRTFPSLANTYQLIGINTSHGIVLQDISLTPSSHADADNPTYSVTGTIVNSSADERPIPYIRVTILDSNNHSVGTHTFLPEPSNDPDNDGNTNPTTIPSGEVIDVYNTLPPLYDDAKEIIVEAGTGMEFFLR